MRISFVPPIHRLCRLTILTGPALPPTVANHPRSKKDSRHERYDATSLLRRHPELCDEPRSIAHGELLVNGLNMISHRGRRNGKLQCNLFVVLAARDSI